MMSSEVTEVKKQGVESEVHAQKSEIDVNTQGIATELHAEQFEAKMEDVKTEGIDSGIRDPAEIRAEVQNQPIENQGILEEAAHLSGRVAGAAKTTAVATAVAAKDAVVHAGQYTAEKAKDAAVITAEKAKDAAVSAKEAVIHAGHYTAEKAKEAAVVAGNYTKEKAVAAGEFTKEKAIAAGEFTKEKAIQAGELAKEKAVAATEIAKEKAAVVGEAAKEKAAVVGNLAKETAVAAGEAAKETAVAAKDLLVGGCAKRRQSDDMSDEEQVDIHFEKATKKQVKEAGELKEKFGEKEIYDRPLESGFHEMSLDKPLDQPIQPLDLPIQSLHQPIQPLATQPGIFKMDTIEKKDSLGLERELDPLAPPFVPHHGATLPSESTLDKGVYDTYETTTLPKDGAIYETTFPKDVLGGTQAKGFDANLDQKFSATGEKQHLLGSFQDTTLDEKTDMMGGVHSPDLSFQDAAPDKGIQNTFGQKDFLGSGIEKKEGLYQGGDFPTGVVSQKDFLGSGTGNSYSGVGERKDFLGTGNEQNMDLSQGNFSGEKDFLGRTEQNAGLSQSNFSGQKDILGNAIEKKDQSTFSSGIGGTENTGLYQGNFSGQKDFLGSGIENKEHGTFSSGIDENNDLSFLNRDAAVDGRLGQSFGVRDNTTSEERAKLGIYDKTDKAVLGERPVLGERTLSSKNRFDNASNTLANKTSAVSEKAGQLKDSAIEKGTQLKDAALEKGGQLKDAALEKGGQWKDAAVDKASQLKADAAVKGSQLKDSALDKSSQLGQATKEKALETGEQLKGKAVDAGHAVQEKGIAMKAAHEKGFIQQEARADKENVRY